MKHSAARVAGEGSMFCCENTAHPKEQSSKPWLVVLNIWVFPKIGVPQNGWFIMENPIKMDDLGVPLFSETSIWRFS